MKKKNIIISIYTLAVWALGITAFLMVFNEDLLGKLTNEEFVMQKIQGSLLACVMVLLAVNRRKYTNRIAKFFKNIMFQYRDEETHSRIV